MKCVNVGNDWAGSIVVKRDPVSHAVGYWHGITGTETMDYNFHIGATHNDDQEQFGYGGKPSVDLAKAMKLGIAFDSPHLGEVRMSEQGQKKVKRDVESTYGLNMPINNVTKCTTFGNDGAGIYQWVVATADGTARSFTSHTICREGDLSLSEPECPYFACLNADCSECADNWWWPGSVYTFSTGF